MKFRLRPQLTYSNVIASVALFVALGGAAVAAGLPRNSVGPNQIKRGAVTTAKLRKAAVRSGKLAPKAVTAGKLGPNSVGPGNIGNGAVNSAKIGGGAVTGDQIKNNVVTTNKLNNNAVTSAKLAPNAVETSNLLNGSVTLGKLAEDVSPLLGTLKSRADAARRVRHRRTPPAAVRKNSPSERSAIQFPISGNPPAVTVLKKGETTANCAGIGSGSAPSATAGNLCVYLTDEVNLDDSETG